MLGDEDLTPPEELKELWEEFRKSRRRLSKQITPNRYHFSLQAVAGAFCLYWLFCPPSAGPALLVLAGLGALMLLSDMKPKHKAIYVFVVIFLVFIEYRAMNRDRRDAQQKYEQNMNQLMGGDGYPLFLVTFPSNNPTREDPWPVRVIYDKPDSATPLLDVNVDLEVIPHGVSGFNNEVLESIMHPVHFSLGTVLPGSFETPIKLQSGKRYYLTIRTRRGGFFYEKIYIDADVKLAGGYKIAWCVYDHVTNKLLGGKCD